jgi:uncharacterized protein YcfJ
MDNSMLKGLIIGGVAATAVGAAAGYKVIETRQSYAEVLSVEPVVKVVSTPRQVCSDVAVTHKAPVKDPNRVTGAVIGAVLGGVVGNQIGDGDGQKLATVAGAAAGRLRGQQGAEADAGQQYLPDDGTTLQDRLRDPRKARWLRRALQVAGPGRHRAHGSRSRRTHTRRGWRTGPEEGGDDQELTSRSS